MSLQMAHLTASQLVHHMILGCICVLKLIHQNVRVRLLVALQYVRPISEEGHNASHQVIIVKVAA